MWLKGITIIILTAKSSYINIIENVWQVRARSVRIGHWIYIIMDELMAEIKDVRESLSDAYKQKLCCSILRRCFAIIDAKANDAKY